MRRRVLLAVLGSVLMILGGFFFVLLGSLFSNTPIWGVAIGWLFYTVLPFMIGRRLVAGRWWGRAER